MKIPRFNFVLLIATTAIIALTAENSTFAQTYEPSCESCRPQRRYGSYEPEACQPIPPPPPFFAPWGWGYGYGYGYGGYPWGFAGYPGYSYGYGNGGYYGNWGGYYGNYGSGPWGGLNPPPEAAYPGYSPGASRWYYGQSWFLPRPGYYW